MITIRREIHDAPGDRRARGGPLYAIGDIHGCYDLLHALLAEIGRDASERHAGEIPRLILCGDYIDRGPASSKVLAALAWLMRSSAVETRLLEGNHEAMLRMFLKNPEDTKEWLDYGGRQTLASYGIFVPEAVEEFGLLTSLRDALLDAMPASHHMVLQRLEPIIEIGSYVFVHAGVKPGVPLSKQVRNDLLWIRHEFLNHSQPTSGVVVHGHTSDENRATLLPHRIGLDTGAYKTGVLTGISFADDAVEIIQAVRDCGY